MTSSRFPTKIRTKTQSLMITPGSLCNMDADCECGCDGYDDVDDDDD